MNNYVVYIHTSPSGKKYVGVTSQDVNKRWLRGHGYFRNEYFTRAINKYGWDNFKHEIVAAGLSKEGAEFLEKTLIARYRSNLKRYGYNIKDGGDTNGKHAERSKRLMSEHRKGKGTGPRSETARRHMRESHSGGAVPKRVLCVETGVTYESINAAARAVGINKKLFQVVAEVSSTTKPLLGIIGNFARGRLCHCSTEYFVLTRLKRATRHYLMPAHFFRL